ncbi:MAG: sulfite exporter TauE/SafE family protein [Pseudomonadota bacterium]
MLELSPLFFALAVPGVMIAGISKGGFGSGVSFAATPLLAIVVDPAIALGVMLPLLMLIDVAALKPYWRQWSVSDTWALIIGGLPGVAIGAVVLARANDDLLRLLIGTIALAFVVYQIAGRRAAMPSTERVFPTWVGLLTGVVGGFTSLVSHAGGPAVAVYLLSRGLPKTTYQATTVISFGVINIFKAVAYGFLGIISLDTLWANLVLAPFAVLGTWLGVVLHRRIPADLFFAVMYVFLAVTGVKLIYDALV